MKRAAMLVGMSMMATGAFGASLVADVRGAIARKEFAAAEKLVKDYRAQSGATVEALEAMSWLGRGALAAKDYDKAETWAQETEALAAAMLKSRRLDDDRGLPIALGAAIEVQAQCLAARNERSAAVDYLSRQLAAYRGTSIRTRIQKNLHLLSLEGKRAPALQGFAAPAGKPLLMFFWAHWCPDCKAMAPALAKLAASYGPRGLTLVLPTQRYGYTRRGADATPEVETRYIEEMLRVQYAPVATAPAPINEENFKNYGCSTTPTIVLVDKAGAVRLYHPGAMSYEELEPLVRALF